MVYLQLVKLCCLISFVGATDYDTCWTESQCQNSQNVKIDDGGGICPSRKICCPTTEYCANAKLATNGECTVNPGASRGTWTKWDPTCECKDCGVNPNCCEEECKQCEASGGVCNDQCGAGSKSCGCKSKNSNPDDNGLSGG